MYFYLEWFNKRPSKIQLVHDKPSELTFESNFKIKGKEYIICGNINPNFKDYIISEPIIYRKNQYLLSHLQKSIRRMETVKSVQTAKHLIDLDCNSFLRRLPIIMIEDVTLHSSFPVIIWLMIAYSKKYVLKEEIIKWLLGVVYYISICDKKTYYEKEKTTLDIDGNNDIIINSLRFRKAYGGMTGDMEMIEYYTHLVYNNKLTIDNGKIIPIKKIEPLKKSEWIYESNDFHCNRYIIKKIGFKYPEYNDEEIKNLIWIFSSSYNIREIQTSKTKDEIKKWDKIKDTVKKVQKECIYY